MVRFKLMCYFLQVLSRGTLLKIEEGRIEVDIFIILSYLVVIMYFIHKSYRGGYAGIIGICITGKYVVNITLSSYIG